MSNNQAISNGYTKEIFVVDGPFALHLFVRPDCDFDTEFKAYCVEEDWYILVPGQTVEGVYSVH